jgi:hypothetical protein
MLDPEQLRAECMGLGGGPPEAKGKPIREVDTREKHHEKT